MDYGMISLIEKAKRYAEEPQRITFHNFTVLFRGDNNTYTIKLAENHWHCSCPGFGNHGICPHIMTLERLFGPMLKRDPLPYGSNQNVVSDVEKSKRYAGEPDRLTFVTFTASFEGNNGSHVVNFDHGQWHSDSNTFQMRGFSSHTIALERILGDMLQQPETVE